MRLMPPKLLCLASKILRLGELLLFGDVSGIPIYFEHGRHCVAIFAIFFGKSVIYWG
tara:strand:- start:161 stop:331 length:171 start_codon:yes stop_codon:yes gene_type:complete